MPYSTVGVDSFSAVYTTLPPLGLVVGREADTTAVTGKSYKLVQAAAAIPANAAVYASGVTTSTADATFQVTACSAANQYILGVNDNAGQAIPSGSYFWITIKGKCAPLVAASIAINTFVVSSATSGTLAAAAAGTSLQANIFLLAASGAGGATLAYIA